MEEKKDEPVWGTPEAVVASDEVFAKDLQEDEKVNYGKEKTNNEETGVKDKEKEEKERREEGLPLRVPPGVEVIDAHDAELLQTFIFDHNNYLGVGTFGRVLKAKWRGHDVAIVIHSYPENMQQRWNVLSSLHSPYIVTVMAARVAPTLKDPNYLVIEFEPGGSLSSLISEREKRGEEKGLPLDLVKNYGCDILRALVYMHARNIVHLNLSLHNVLLDGRGRAKLTGFSQAQILDGKEEQGLLGSLHFMAPEIIGDEGHYDTSADIYSFGMLLYAMVTGGVPWDGPVSSFARKVYDGERPNIPDTCPARLAELIRKCWANDPKQRPSAVEVLEELNSFQLKMTFA